MSDYLVYDDLRLGRPVQAGWEELPYWLRGFTDLGIVTGDGRVRGLTGTWIDGILAAQAIGRFVRAGVAADLAGGRPRLLAAHADPGRVARRRRDATGDDPGRRRS